MLTVLGVGAGSLQIWPVARLPLLQQAFAGHLVSLHLPAVVIDPEECVSICGLTRLTSLNLELTARLLPDGSHPVSALSSLQSLHRLTLEGQADGGSLMHVDWSALTSMTLLEIVCMEGSLAAAGTAPHLRSLEVTDLPDETSHAALAQLQSLTCLEFVWFARNHIRGDFHSLQRLSSLKSLLFLECTFSFEAVAGGAARACSALGHLAWLTRLHMENSK